MKRKGMFSILVACMLLPSLALASTSFEGTVVSKNPIAVTAPFGGVIGSVQVQAGERVNAGDSLVEITTTKVYALSSGVVTGLFAQVGDSMDSAVTRYGAPLYLTPKNKYTISANTSKAYSTSDNLYVHLGEVVYLRSYNLQVNNTGIGIITVVDGDNFTVETTEGEFWMGETLSIYREAYDTTTRIGRGDVARTAEIAVSGSGSIVAMHVQDGDAVERGQLLFETVTGSLENLVADGNQIKAPVGGIIESINVSAGSAIETGSLVVTICPKEQMQVLIEINEYDLMDIQVGDTVNLTFSYDDSGMSIGTGTVAQISDISFSTDTSNVTYNVYIDFVPDENIRLGLTVMVDMLEEVFESDDNAVMMEESIDDEGVEDIMPEDMPMPPSGN